MNYLLFLNIFLVLFISCSRPTNAPVPKDVLRNNLMAYGAWDFDKHLLSEYSDLDTVINGVKVLNDATSKVIESLDQMSQDLIDDSGGRNDFFYYKNPNSKGAVNKLMVEQGYANTIKNLLSEYSSVLKELGNPDNDIPISIPNNSLLRNDPRFQGVSFEELHFANSTLTESLTVIETYKLLVYLNHSITLNKLLIEERNAL